MARIDLARRAQIGRDRSARTRAELIAAARGLYAARPFDQVTVDDVVGAAGVAKGTFYVHFDSLAELQSIVADELGARVRRTAAAAPAWRWTIRSSASPPDAALSSCRRCAIPPGARWSRTAPPLCPASPASRASGSKRTSTAPRATDSLTA